VCLLDEEPYEAFKQQPPNPAGQDDSECSDFSLNFFILLKEINFLKYRGDGPRDPNRRILGKSLASILYSLYKMPAKSSSSS